METHSSILAWEIPQRRLVGPSPWDHKESDMTEQLSTPKDEESEKQKKGNRDFIFLGSKITADGDYSHEIKRHLPLGRKVMTNLDSILKSRDITLPRKVRLVKAMVFPGNHV